MNRNPIVILAIGHAICCGGLVLFVTGAGAGITAFLLEGGLGWIAAGIAVAGASILLWARMRRRGRDQGDGREPGEIEQVLETKGPGSKPQLAETSCRCD